LEKNPSRNLAVYVVWVPELGAQPKHVPDAATLVRDPRARHYWDGDEVVGKAYNGVLGIGRIAWDSYFIFDPGKLWDAGSVPTPDFWMHQMSKVRQAPMLSPKVFAAQVAQRTGAAQPAGVR